MEQIKRRIKELTQQIDALRSMRERRDFRYMKESELIIQICELEEERNCYKKIVADNIQLFR